MKSEWRYLIRKLAGQMVYQVYRLKDMNAIDNYDNREYAGDILHNKQEAISLAERMNAKESLVYLAHVIETARQSAERTLYNEFGLTKNDVEVHIGWEGDLDKDGRPYGAVVSMDFGIYNKESVQKFIGKIRKLSTHPIRDGILETLTEINAVCVNDRVFSDVDTDAKIGNEDFFDAGMWARDAIYVLCSKVRLKVLQLLAESYWYIVVEAYLVGKNDLFCPDGRNID